MKTLAMFLASIWGDEEVLLADGFDDAIIGTCSRDGEIVFAYSKKRVVDTLVADGMDHDEAQEYYSFNIESAYVGAKTPVFVDDEFVYLAKKEE